jgi:uncharacterized protein (DUF2062 family)
LITIIKIIVLEIVIGVGLFKRLGQGLKDLIRAQLKQGASPRGLAIACAVGAMLGNFPLMGTTTLLCAILGTVFKLNQPLLQSVNYAMAASQLILIPILLRVGETLVGAPHLSLNPKVIMNEFFAHPGLFFEKFGMAGMHAGLAWLLLAPFLGLTVYFLTLPMFKKVARKTARKAD